MNFRNRKFSEFSESLNKRSNEKGRSKSDALPHKRKVSFKEDLFIRNSYDGHLFEKHRECISRRLSLNIQKQSDVRLPSIVNNVVNRRLSLNVQQPIPEVIFPAINAYNFDQRTLFKTKSTQNFSSMTGKKAQGQLNRKGGKRMRRILSLDNFFPPQFKNRILSRYRFRRAVKTVLILLRVIRTNENTSRNEVLSWAHHDELTTKRIYGLHGLSFDPGDYACRKEERLSNEAITILSMNPEERTDEQCKLALLALNHTVKAFGEFPKAMQKSLVRVGWYEKYEDKRVIIRQGHVADNFYFILSGNAIVTLMETDEETEDEVIRTKAVLKKGNSFGELALMHGSRRTATVTCKSEVELLAVWREDFVDIFMPHTYEKEPEHIKFLRTVTSLSGWPIHKLPYHDPKICCFTYFRRGVLLCRNSNTSEWIYIIKSGSCRVLTELHDTKPLPKLHLEKVKVPRLDSVKTLSKQVKPIYYKKKSNRCSSENIVKILRGPLCVDKANIDEHKRYLDVIYELHKHKLNNGSRHRKNLNHHKNESACSSASARYTSVFVHIQTLGPRDVYGLEHIAFGKFAKTTSTTLVSDGAECILISKKFLMQHLTDDEVKKLRNNIQPLPSEEHLQQKLQDTTNWLAYKTLTINNQVFNNKIRNDCLV
ncbi:cyclic nucleotide-binding domain-containing protein 2-like isoform X1 [Mytilus edulis]|uniref:cyclic nucleotide-binding domain-containing protein 2-like isoform X1 n=1 Tax=Mytilus edulis TaxID=6550 RepID=UPI0039F04ECD